MNNHIDFYSEAELYDIAFDFIDVSKECHFLLETYNKVVGRKAASFLEMGCGPGRHTSAMGNLGLRSLGIDLSREMIVYASRNKNKNTEFVVANMIEFQLDAKFDFAGIFMDSTSYLLSNEDVLLHLNSVAKHLTPGGLYFLEMAHPRDVFGMGKSTETTWEAERGGTKIKMQWGSSSDSFDPLTQISQTSVHLIAEMNGKKREIEDKAPQRSFTATEFAALVKASGVFKLIDVFGAMDLAIPFSSEKEAWRMIPVLQVL